MTNNLEKLYNETTNWVFNNIYNLNEDWNISLFFDAAGRWQMGFQDPATALMEGMIDLHNELMFFLWGVVIVVFYINIITISNFNAFTNKFWYPIPIRHDSLLEIIWTIIPTIILIIIAVPSFALLYAMDEILDPVVTFKAIGHQWYWHYEYDDYSFGGDSIFYESYMIQERDLIRNHWGTLRLLETDKRIVVPIKSHIRMLVTAADVIHCWTIPSLGIKIDACPGRLNQVSYYIKRVGVFYGQCSEICGVNHGFMPIALEAVELNDFLAWIITNIAFDDDKILKAKHANILEYLPVNKLFFFGSEWIVREDPFSVDEMLDHIELEYLLNDNFRFLVPFAAEFMSRNVIELFINNTSYWGPSSSSAQRFIEEWAATKAIMAKLYAKAFLMAGFPISGNTEIDKIDVSAFAEDDKEFWDGLVKGAQERYNNIK